MNGVQTIIDVLVARSKTHAGALAYRCLMGPEQAPQELSYAELHRRAAQVGLALRRAGLGSQRILITAQAEPGFLTAFYGCLLAGAVPVMAFTPRKHRLGALSGIVEVAAPAAMISSATGLGQLADRAHVLGVDASVQLLDWEVLGAAEQESASSFLPGPDALAFLQFSSGSTSAPKGIRVGHGQLLANLERQAKALAHPQGAPIVSWLPLHHDMGLVGQMLWGLYLGAPVTLMSPIHFVEQPIRWLEAISKYQAYTSGGPNFAYQACLARVSGKALQGLDLSSWKVAFNGAEPVQMSTMERFSERFAVAGFDASAFLPSYGLAECCVFVSAGRAKELWLDKAALAQHEVKPSTLGAQAQSLVSCGALVLGDEASICDPQTKQALGPGQIGEIVVRSPSVCGGYWNHPEATARSFSLAHEGPNTLYTGDLGFIHEGQIYVTGRIKDLIIFRGQNIYPQDLEQALDDARFSEHLGMNAAIGVDQGQGEVPVLVCELTRAGLGQIQRLGELGKEIRAWVGQRTGVELASVVFVRPASVPRTSSGKVQRRACAAALVNERLKLVARIDFAAPFGSNEGDFEQAIELVEHFVRSRLGIVELQGRSVFELGLGSLDCALLAQSLGRFLQRKVSLASLMDAPDLAGWVRAQQIPSAQALAPLPQDCSVYPLSPGQRAIWAVHQNAVDPGVYNVHLVIEVSGNVDAEHLRVAFNRLRARHAVLRTRVQKKDAGLYAQVLEPNEGELDWRVIPVQEQVSGQVEALLRAPFDLAGQDPMRLRYLPKAQAGGGTLVWVMHHIAVDFWSLVVLVRELGTLLEEPDCIQAQVAYSYAQWQAHHRARLVEQGGKDWAYWSQMLGGELPSQTIALDRPRDTATKAHAGAYHHLQIDAALVDGLDRIAKRCGTSRFRIYLALFGLALARQGGQQDLVIGTPITGRDDVRWQNVVGYFVNPAAIRLRVSPQDSLGQYLGQVTQRVQEAMEHQSLPFAELVERLAPARDSKSWPLYQVAFTYQSSHDPDLAQLSALALQDGRAKLRFGELTFGHAQTQERVENFDLKLVMADAQDELLAAFLYDTAVLDAVSVKALAQEWLALAKAWVGATQNTPLWQLRGRRAAAFEPSPSGKGGAQEHLAARWDALVREAPNRGCIEHAQRDYSVRGLDQWSTALLLYMREQGVKRGDRVGLMLEMSPSFVATALACVRMGVSYVPIDPRYPVARKTLIAQDARLCGLWCGDEAQTTNQELKALRGTQGLACWRVSGVSQEAPGDVRPELTAPRSEEIVYLVYTSGSTGTPKGVEVSHRALLTLVDWHQARYETSQETRALPSASVGFDASVWELWPNLLGGATLVLAPTGLSKEPDVFLAWVAKQRVDTLFLPTALLEACLACAWPWHPKHLLTGGDALGAVQPQLQSLGLCLHNHYGPTEFAVVASAGEVDLKKRGPPSIGAALPGVYAHVLDAQLEPCAVGAVGTLYLAGPQLAQGYAHNPKETALRFVPHPFGAPGERMYNTGDRMRMDAGGELCFQGRADHQVQIRGQRVEPAEVEAFLASQPEVQSARVLAKANAQGQLALAAYVLPEKDGGTGETGYEVEQVRDWKALYEDTYAPLVGSGGVTRDDRDLVGWRHSDTGKEIDPKQMWSWVQDSVDAISALEPKVLLEIGAGSGLLAKAIAPQTQRYFASDLSSNAVAHLEAWAKDAGCEGLVGICASADALLEHPALASALDHIETVVLNSVLQYFPSSQYLQSLFAQLFQELPSLRQIYIGDVRDASLLSLFHQQNAWARAGQKQSLYTVSQAAKRLESLDRELCVAPGWWATFDPAWRAVTSLRPGDYANELSRYRYDVRLWRPQAPGPDAEPAVLVVDQASSNAGRVQDVGRGKVDNGSGSTQPIAHCELCPELPTLEGIAQIIAGVLGPTVVGGLFDQRLDEATALDQALAGRSSGAQRYLRVQDLEFARKPHPHRCCPHEVYQMARNAGLEVRLLGGKERRRGAFELWLAPTGQGAILDTYAAARTHEASQALHEPGWSRRLSELPTILHKRMCEQLPSHLVPSSVTAVHAWPSTMHGKLDRLALPEPTEVQANAPLARPQNVKERVLCEVYGEVLGFARVDVTQNFFAMGGDSILAIQIASKVRSKGWSLRSGDVLDHPSIRALAPLLVKASVQGPSPQHRVQRTRLTAMQQGLWIEQVDAPDRYLECLALRFEGQLCPVSLRRAWCEVIGAHDALRCRFSWDEQGAYQQACELRSDDMDWQTVEGQVPEWSLDPFELSRAPLMRWRLYQRAPQQWELHWMHAHILLDGWSVALVVSQVLKRYAQLLARDPSAPLCALPSGPSFLGWVHQQEAANQEREIAKFWRGLAPSWQSAGGSELWQRASGRSERITLELSSELNAQIQGVARQANTTVSTLITCAWAELWRKVGGTRSAVLGVIDAGRDDPAPEIQDLVGLLIESFPWIRPSVQEPGSWRELWCKGAKELRQAKKMAKGQAASSLARWLGAQRAGELFSCLVAVENYPRSAKLGAVAPGLSLVEVEHRGSTHYPVTLVVGVHEGLRLQLEVDGQRICKTSAKGWLLGLRDLLAACVAAPDNDVAQAIEQLAVDSIATAIQTPNAPDAPRTLGLGHEAGPEPEFVAALWAQALQRKSVGSDDDFFALGGDSIVAMTLVQTLRAQGWACSVQTLMNAKTPAKLASQLRPVQGRLGHERGDQPGDRVALNPIQHWLLTQGLDAPSQFNQALRLPAPQGVRKEQLAAALEGLARHHAAIRANLVGDGPAHWALQIHGSAQGRWPLEVLDLRGMAATPAQVALASRCEALQGSFDLRRGPLFVALLVEGGTSQRELVLMAHHLVVDAVSWRILLGDLDQLLRVPQGPLDPVPSSLGAAARALASYGESAAQSQINDWRGVVQAKGPAWLGEHDPGTVGQRRFLRAELDADATQALLREGTQAHRARLQELLLAGLARSMTHWPGVQEVVLDLEGHGRYEEALGLCLDRSIGWFTNQFPVRLSCQAHRSWAQSIEQTKRAMRAIPDQGLGFGILRQRQEVPPSPARVSFNYLGQVDERFAGASSMLGASLQRQDEIGSCHAPQNRCAYVMDLNLSLVSGSLWIHAGIGPSLDSARVQSWLDAWVLELTRVCEPETGDAQAAVQLSDFDLVLGELDEADLKSILNKVEQS